MIKAVIFDWDGVIVDSMPFIAKGLQEVASSYGVKLTLDEVLDGYFQPRDAWYRSLGIDTTNQEELNKRHWAAIHKYQRPAQIFPEATEVLRSLKENDFNLGVASTAETTYILEQLERFGLKDIFQKEWVLGGEISKEEKLKEFLKTFQVSPEEIMYVGDLPSDIVAARATNVKAAGIERREAARQRLSALNPDYLFSSLNELKKLLNQI